MCTKKYIIKYSAQYFLTDGYPDTCLSKRYVELSIVGIY